MASDTRGSFNSIKSLNAFSGVWTFRAWRWGYPVPLDLDRWQLTDIDDVELYRKEVRAIQHAWKFLGPFFASRGYTLYQNRPPAIFTLLPAPPALPGAETHIGPSYPFACRVFKEDCEAEFGFMSLRVWPARDAAGRDVVIKLISGATPSDELKILQRLNTQEARSDSRNHSIHVLDYVSFDGLVFAVMPRWDPAFNHDFNTVAELIHITEAFLNGFDFLHENRIAHCDFLEQNTGINILADTRAIYLKGMRDMSTTRYAIYDFGYSLVYPLETVLEDVKESRFLNFGLRGLPTPLGPYNPFQADVAFLGITLQGWVRHIENIVPELGPFFESMIYDDTKKRLTARHALKEFQRIHPQLSPSQLNQTVTGRYWDDGRVQPKQ